MASIRSFMVTLKKKKETARTVHESISRLLTVHLLSFHPSSRPARLQTTPLQKKLITLKLAVCFYIKRLRIPPYITTIRRFAAQ